MDRFDPFSARDLLLAHGLMMDGLLEGAGRWRGAAVGVLKDGAVAHMAPPAGQVAGWMERLFTFVADDQNHLLIRGCVFHYELEFIHPFADGNGRMGRLWHTLLLTRFHPAFAHVPVESLIRDRQQEYYAALGAADAAGEATPFIEFSLGRIRHALGEFVDAIRPPAASAESRLRHAARHFGTQAFSRRDYLALFKVISTATASRDLALGARSRLLLKSGDKALAVYRFADGSN